MKSPYLVQDVTVGKPEAAFPCGYLYPSYLSADVPYLIITKSSSIIRDLELHARYRYRCAIVWSLTTIDEKTKRLIEPYTPTAKSVLQTIGRFAEKVRYIWLSIRIVSRFGGGQLRRRFNTQETAGEHT